jgi:hypothetical protein
VWDSPLTFHKIREVLPKSRDTRGSVSAYRRWAETYRRVGVSAVGTRSRAIRRCASGVARPMNAQPKGVRGKSAKVGLQRRATPSRGSATLTATRTGTFSTRVWRRRRHADTPIRRHVSPPASDRAGSSDPEVSETKFLHGFRVE